LANELKHDFKISFITYNEGGSSKEQVDGIDIIKTYSLEKRPNLLLKIFLIWKAMLEANADIYFQHGGAGFIVPLFCRIIRKRCVVGIGSDAYVDKEIKDWGFLFRFGSKLEIMLANVIIAQSNFQKVMLVKNFYKNSFLIKNPFPIGTKKKPMKLNPSIVLWVGSISDVKQPDLFLKLAKIMPEIKFQMIASKGEKEDDYDKIREISQTIPNLDFLGFIPFNQINQYYERASILANTSKFEGFPNAFIQSWMNYTPVVSLNADPDEIICKYGLGLHSRTFGQLVDDIKTLIKNERLREEMGKNGRQYVEKEHDITQITNHYVDLFSHLLQN
jgi:glycosyltransferase involved in cell wall biosynthesis